ncbi:GFA family protein [Hyphococcus flavus]|uniref:GFA family protein n=1 Tax=Hyphococcus flavus TaxID=1866326 RepID=A0AAE9ZGV4_9PROT|nr:GFA family protein [Hyphococcus flavus]WDI30606.1 GFA family protein [Hyphococcus flavus]
MTQKTGRCMCGAIEYIFEADRKDVIVCHCGQCRQWSGHLWASVNAAFDKLEITKGMDRLRWFRSSDAARRGFCRECGSALFWHGDKIEGRKERIAIAAGTVNAPTDFYQGEHIFQDDKGDYYEIA